MARQTRAEAEANSEVWRLLATLATATNADGTPYSLPVTQPTPLAADVLAGRQAFTATTAATTLITIPAGRIWIGHVGASVVCTTAPTGTTAGQASAVISTAGTGVTPAAGNYLGVDAMTAVNQATGGPGTANSNSISAPLTVAAPAGNSVTVQVAATIAGTSGRVDAYASGSLVAQ